MNNKFKSEIFLFERSYGGPLHVLNCFPNTYEVGMASLAYQTVFKLYATNPNTHTFRYFTDLQEHYPKELDLLTFSISWELDFFNIFDILQKLQIPILAEDRDESHPVILAGGPVVTANPAPWAKYFDVIAIGDCESNTDAIIDTCLKHRRSDLLAYTDIPGVYVPSANQKFVDRAKSSNKQMQAYAHAIIYTRKHRHTQTYAHPNIGTRAPLHPWLYRACARMSTSPAPPP